MIKQFFKVVIVSVVLGTQVRCSIAVKERGSVTWITSKPTQAITDPPTYDFPSASPVSIQLLMSSQPTAEPPFFTSLPTKAPSKSIAFTGSKTTDEIPATSDEKPKLFLATKSSKEPKGSKTPSSNQNDSPAISTPMTPSVIQSPTYSPFEPEDATPSPSLAPQQQHSSSGDCDYAKWHPNVGFDKCTNSVEYPQDWDATPDLERHYFRATLQQCCEFVFGLIGVCEFEDVCSVESPSASPSNIPSSSPSGVPSSTMTVSPLKQLNCLLAFCAILTGIYL